MWMNALVVCLAGIIKFHHVVRVVVRRSPAPPAQPDSSPTPSLSRWTKSPNGIRSRATSGESVSEAH